ncbi:MAG: hypothetical protein KGL38_10305 [Gemmatimonadota bacterium]|nr:hypothetical protein [Gemmatimonadota bacterium]MDE3128387.1 hypothetical protein [Gemmatimonadota bacterium]MDE3172568.1 hypothetical protein [Gemmatimonadota bacterium]MDE3217457.1 hypothetical protein [Gemmatimonadota bacterium]
MFARALTPAALAAAFALTLAPAASAQQFRYAPGTAQYRMTVDAKVTQTMMGQNNQNEVTSGQKFTVALARQAGDTLSMDVTIDSLAQMTPLGPMPGLDSLIGKKVHALLSSSGEVYSSRVDAADSATMLASISSQLVHFLPAIHAALTDGATWTDTVSTNSNQNGLNLKRTVISRYTVDGDTTVGGAQAHKLRRESTSTTSGSGTMQGQAVTMSGTSTGTGVAVVTSNGTFLGSTNTEDAKASVTLTDAGMTIDSQTNAQTKVEKIGG